MNESESHIDLRKGKETRTDKSTAREQHKDNTTVELAKQMIELTQKQYDERVAAVEDSASYLNDSELLKIFAEYFSPSINFITDIGSPKYTAYFEVVNAATLEMINNPKLYHHATKREQAELVAMCNNRIPGITNRLICGLIFSMGKYAVVPSNMLCVDFADAIPNCIAVYLFYMAQKLPVDNREQVISVGDGVSKQAFEKAMKTLSVCDSNWKYSIFQA